MGGNAVQNCSVKPVQETQTETRVQGLRSSFIHQGDFFVVLAWSESEVCNAVLGHLVVLHFRLRLWTLIGGSSPRLTACQGWKAQSTHRWLGMHRPLTVFSSPAEAVCWGVATVIPNSFLGPQKWELSAGWGPVSLPIPRDDAVGFTKVLPLPKHPVHPRMSETLNHIVLLRGANSVRPPPICESIRRWANHSQ